MATSRPTLNRIWASADDSETTDPGDAKYQEGWEAEIPTYQVLNYLQNKLDTTLLALAERGFFEWGSDVNYVKGALAWDEATGGVYIALVDNPSTTLVPSANTSQWAASSVQISRKQFDDAVTEMNTHIASLGGTNPHQLKPHDVDTYSTDEIDEKIEEEQEQIDAHTADMDNPHETTADLIGAVPVTGGTYTGDVYFPGIVYFDTTGDGFGQSNSDGVMIGQTATDGLVYSIGVDVDGLASYWANGVKYEIVHDNNFEAKMDVIAPKYGRMQPSFLSPFCSDINMLAGTGTVTYACPAYVSGSTNMVADTPYYSNGRLILHTESGAYSTLAYDDLGFITPSGPTGYAVALDVTCDSSAVTHTMMVLGADSVQSLHFVLSATELQILEYVAGAQSGNKTSYSFTVSDKLHRVVINVDNANRKFYLYIDGVHHGQTANLTQLLDMSGGFSVTSSASSGTFNTYVNNMRVWNSCMTAEQIAAL